MKFDSRPRINLFYALILAFALIIVGRLYVLQVVRAEEFAHKADRQYVQSTYDYYNRGTIFFETKDGENPPAAMLKPGFIIAINPMLIRDPESAFEALSSVLTLDKNEFLTKANKPNDPYEEVARRVPREDADKVSALKIPGVGLYEERWRSYPWNSMAAQTIGFVAYDDTNRLAGRYGLERYYNEVLDRNNDNVYVNFFVEIFSNIQESVTGDRKPEGNIVTSIEPTVQGFLEQTLSKFDTNWDSNVTGGIIMDPMTGRIIALGATPTFDLNAFQKVSDISIFSNDLVENVYEMGSIVKPLTVAAGLDSGAITPQSTYYDAGSMTLNGRTFSNYDGRARGLVPVQEILNQSLNTGVAHIVQKMGKGKFAEYMLDFGLGEETGIDLPNETHGLVQNLESPRDIEYATASFGQGIAITPIETVRALAALGNGGKLVSPHLVTRIDYRLGGSKKIVPAPERQVISKETSEDITRMLVNVVDTALLGGTVKMDRYSIAAKTGTAQMAAPRGGYYDDRFLHSFFGYFPAFNPRFIVFLYSVDPKGARYASETLTYPFMDIAQFLINYYQIPPDR